MAGSLLALLDDISTVLDDVALLAKVAAKKTAGVLGDDLALNAQQVSGVHASRELPVVGAVALGSLKNKLILVPAALALSAVAPWLVHPLLMIGGLYLCFEGFEKLAHSLFAHQDHEALQEERLEQALADPAVDFVKIEQTQIAGAIRTDFVLSAEIVAIALGTVEEAAFATRALVVSSIALGMTVGVYGFVAAIVKLDDLGLYLSRLQRPLADLGRGLLVAAPLLMKALSVVGTAAMFLVGGGILSHGLPGAHELSHDLSHAVESLPLLGAHLASAASWLFDAAVGIVAGALAVGVQSVGRLVFPAVARR